MYWCRLVGRKGRKRNACTEATSTNSVKRVGSWARRTIFSVGSALEIQTNRDSHRGKEREKSRERESEREKGREKGREREEEGIPPISRGSWSYEQFRPLSRDRCSIRVPLPRSLTHYVTSRSRFRHTSQLSANFVSPHDSTRYLPTDRKIQRGEQINSRVCEIWKKKERGNSGRVTDSIR